MCARKYQRRVKSETPKARVAALEVPWLMATWWVGVPREAWARAVGEEQARMTASRYGRILESKVSP